MAKVKEGATAPVVQECRICGRRLFLRRNRGRDGFLGTWEPDHKHERQIRGWWASKHLGKALEKAGTYTGELAELLGVPAIPLIRVADGYGGGYVGSLPALQAWISAILPISPDFRPGSGGSVEIHRCEFRAAAMRTNRAGDHARARAMGGGAVAK